VEEGESKHTNTLVWSWILRHVSRVLRRWWCLCLCVSKKEVEFKHTIDYIFHKGAGVAITSTLSTPTTEEVRTGLESCTQIGNTSRERALSVG
jgi:hypothetical protein